MGNKEDLLPRYVAHARNLLDNARARALCTPWLATVVLMLYCAYGLLFPRHACPPDFLCVPNDVGGSSTLTTPYIEYSEVTSSATVYRVSSLLKTVKTPYQLIQVRERERHGRLTASLFLALAHGSLSRASYASRSTLPCSLRSTSLSSSVRF